MPCPVSAVVAAAVLTLLLVGDAQLESTRRSNITLVDNGYEGILIAIGESVPESDSAKVLSQIENYFIEASQTLYRATYNRVYFRNVTVLLPKSWTSTNYDAATTETFSKANVVIDGQGLDTPTTWTYGNCGEPGEFIQIPVGYMTADGSAIIRLTGKPGPTLVHEWGHLRWGLRDEYPIAGEERFYRDSNNQVAAVKCGKHMKGKGVDDVTGGSCTTNSTTGLPTNTCHFEADAATGVIASLMFYHNLTEVVTFCDNDESNLETLHNDEAPSQQNTVCGGRSAWEVMRDHEDFRDGNSPPRAQQGSPEPHFRYVQAQNTRIVMILDVSGSMVFNKNNGVTRLEKLRHASADFLLTVVPQGMYVGLVNFSTEAAIIANLTEVTSTAVRQELVNKLPDNAQGITAIGKGLLQGIKLLENTGDPRGGVLILVSDGEENEPPWMDEVKVDLLAKGVVLDVILISEAADRQLIELSAATGGKAFFDSGSPDSADLQSAFRTIVSDDAASSPGGSPVEVLLETVFIGRNEEVNRFVNVDSSIGRDTRFTFSYIGRNLTLYVAVMSPSGANYTADGPHSHNCVASKTVTIAIHNETEVGRWTIIMKNRDTSPVATRLLVTSKSPSDDSYPIRARTFLNQQHIDFNDSSALKVVVRAQVKKGYAPVVGAKVEFQFGSLPWKLMKDDGLGVDAVKDDGYYSAVLFNFTSNGYFPVKVRTTANGGNETRLLTRGGIQAFQLFAVNGEKTNPSNEMIEPFDRSSDAGLISVNNVKSKSEMKTLFPFPPAVVKDLKVTEMSYQNGTVTLEWTSVGDYEEQERASSYNIRFSSDIKELRYSFDNSSQINNSDVIAGQMSSPLTATEKEVFVIRFPAGYNNKTLFFGLKVNHSIDRISDVSNIVSAAITYVPPKSPPTSTSEPDYTQNGDATIDGTATIKYETEIDSTTTSTTTMMEPTTESDRTTTSTTTTMTHTTESDGTTTRATTTVTPTTESDGTTTRTTTTVTPTTESDGTTRRATTTVTPTTESDGTTTRATTTVTPTTDPDDTIVITSTNVVHSADSHPYITTTKVTSTLEHTSELRFITSTAATNEHSSTRERTTEIPFNNITASTNRPSTIQERTTEAPVKTSTDTTNKPSTPHEHTTEVKINGIIATTNKPSTTHEHTTEVPVRTSTAATINSSTTHQRTSEVPVRTSTAATTNPTTTDTPSYTTSANETNGQEPELPHSSAEAQFAIRIALGTASLLILLTAIPVAIKITRSRKARRNVGREENGLGENHLHRGNYDGRLPYSIPGDNWSAVGLRSVGDVKPCYLPQTNPYRLYKYGR